MDFKKYKNSPWQSVTKEQPCSHCGKPDWCGRDYDGHWDFCRRESVGAINEKEDKDGIPYWVYKGPNADVKSSYNNKSKIRTERGHTEVNKEGLVKFTEINSQENIDTDLIDQVYSDVIRGCKLFDDQADNLLSRGYKPDDLENFGSTRNLNVEFVEALAKKYGSRLKQVPGFHLEPMVDGDHRWKFPSAQGILIPSRNKDDKIVSLRIRKDAVEEGESRYVYFSLGEKVQGISAITNVHVVDWQNESPSLLVTEGEIKCELAARHFNCTTLGCPGVGSAKKSLALIREKNPKKVELAFDKDIARKKQVLNPVAKLYFTLTREGFDVSILHWPSEDAKGVDDAIRLEQEFSYLKGDEAKKYFSSIANNLEVEFSSLEYGYSDIGQGEVWPEEPLELETVAKKLPEIKEEDIPSAIRSYCIHTSRQGSVALVFIVVAFFSVIASLIGRRVVVKPKRNSSWKIVPVFWTMLIGRPSVRKTIAIMAAVKFLNKLMVDWVEINRNSASSWGAEKALLEAEKSKILNGMGGAKKQNPIDRDTAKSQLAEIEFKLKNCRPLTKELFTTDATKEKVIEILRDNICGILYYRDELSGLLNSLGMKGRETDRAFILETFNGDTPVREDRKTRESVHLPAATLSILGGIQPGVIAQHIASTNNGGQGADGLMARFSGMVYPDKPSFEYYDEPEIEDAEDKIELTLKRLRDFDGEKIKTCGRDKEGLPFLEFDNDAQRVFVEWLVFHERKISKGNISEALEAHLGKYTKAVCTLAIIFHLLEWAEAEDSKGFVDKISVRALKFGIRWMEILQVHAENVYDGLASPQTAPVVVLLEKIEDGLVQHEMTVREIYRKEWSGLASREAVVNACKTLEKAGHLKVIKRKNNPGLTSEVVLLHPQYRVQKFSPKTEDTLGEENVQS